ncbi:MAG TPA: hypothetical protein ENJ21_02320, partial [Chromatiaceae bacterium]|nr:hypothetical protein [Chromatiaceae bacterium]
DYPSTEFLARRILVLAVASQPIESEIELLLSHENADGGFGELVGHDSTVFDSAWALLALTGAGRLQDVRIPTLIGYLTDTQRPNGAFGFPGEADSLSVTARVLLALSAWRQAYPDAANTVRAASGALLAERQPDQLWGSDERSAGVLLALLASGSDAATLSSSIAALRARQQADGSWNGDVYATALALRVLAYAAPTGTPIVGASVSGRVIDADSGAPLAAARLSDVDSGVSVVTTTNGFFLLDHLDAGARNLVVQRAGYTGVSVLVDLVAGAGRDIGNIALAPRATLGNLRVHLFDAGDGQPLGGVDLSLSATQTYSATTDSAGDLELAGLPPGDYDLRVVADGYTSLQGRITLVAGVTTRLSQALSPIGSFVDTTPLTVRGILQDAETGEPVAGASLKLDGVALASPVGADGGFSIASVERGNHVIDIAADGYLNARYQLLLPAGASGDLGVISLRKANPVAVPTSLTLHGKVVDSVTGAALPDAVIAYQGQTWVSDTSGSFLLSGITEVRFTLTLNAPNHVERSVVVDVLGFGEVSQTFALTPGADNPNPPSESTLNGRVTDASTGAPLAGARVVLQGVGLETSTDANGDYSIAGVATLGFRMVVSAPGHADAMRDVTLPQPGVYAIDEALTALPETPDLQILGLHPVAASVGPDGEAAFAASVVNNGGISRRVQVNAVVGVDAGDVLANLAAEDAATGDLLPEIELAAGESVDLLLRWPVRRNPAGSYRVIARVVEPGTSTSALPSGVVLADAVAQVEVTGASRLAGGIRMSPPLAQAGQTTPIHLSALLVNAGNQPIPAGDYALRIVDPDSGAVVHAVQVSVGALAVNQHLGADFGDWVPDTAGDLSVVVEALAPDVGGRLETTLYVGNRPSGQFDLSRNTTPLGDQMVHARIALQGVNGAEASIIDPLTPLVKTAITDGAVYETAETLAWSDRHRCLGCHIQTQALYGLGAASAKIESIDSAALTRLRNELASAVQDNGSIGDHDQSESQLAQTLLAGWGMAEWPGTDRLLRERIKAAEYVVSRQNTNTVGERWWVSDSLTRLYPNTWWNNEDKVTGMAIDLLAGVVEDSAGRAVTSLRTWRPEALLQVFPGIDPLGIAAGQDGRIYLTGRGSGNLLAYDPASNTTEVVATDIPFDQSGVLREDDGTLVVVGEGGSFLLLHPDGSRDLFQLGTGNLGEVVAGGDGFYYITDGRNNRVLKADASGNFSVFASGSRFGQPVGIAVGAEGAFYVGNNERYNILRITRDGQVSVFADGLRFRPTRLAPDGEGGFFFTTLFKDSLGHTPDSLQHVDAQGLVTRLADAPGMQGIANLNGEIYLMAWGDETLYHVRRSARTVDTRNFKPLISDAARWLLGRLGDNSDDIPTLAWRLLGLGRALPHLDDAQLRDRVGQAITELADTLWADQHADGGWRARLSDSAPSSPLATALVGLALEVTHPSPSDPRVRAVIGFLLNAQSGNGSWGDGTGMMNTRLSSTGLVMAYLPAALARLGGIDIELQLDLPADIHLSSPSEAPADNTLDGNGVEHFTWQLPGVTEAGRSLDFDLLLTDMRPDELRAVALRADLVFDNSFGGERLRLPLTIPDVQAINGLSLAVVTDAPAYPAHADVAITATLGNLLDAPGDGDVALSVYAVGADQPIASLPTVPVTGLAPGGQRPLTVTWNTGVTLSGDYEVRGEALDAQGRVLARASAPFRILAPASELKAEVRADKAVYSPWDNVALSGSVTHLADNRIQPASIATLRVTDPAGGVRYQHDFSLGQLAIGARRALNDSLTLNDAPDGVYQVDLSVRDALSQAELASASAVFRVERGALSGLSGQVTASPFEVTQGAVVRCEYRASNRSAASIDGVTLSYELIATDSQQTLRAFEQTLDLAGGASHPLTDLLGTSDLPPGDYGCIQFARRAGQSRQPLGGDFFRVVAGDNPLQVSLGIQAGGAGRLLVLLDAGDGDDPHDAGGELPDLASQRQALEALLDEAGIAHRIVTSPRAFRDALRSGAFQAYALFDERHRLSSGVQKELREAVVRGEGLLVAGRHDARQTILNTALGIRPRGRVNGIDTLSIDADDLGGPSTYRLLIDAEPPRIAARGAQILARYRLLPGRGDCGCGDGEEDDGHHHAQRHHGDRRDDEAHCDSHHRKSARHGDHHRSHGDDHDKPHHGGHGNDGDDDGHPHHGGHGHEGDDDDEDHPHHGGGQCTPSPVPAISDNAWGRGHALFVAHDLLAEAALGGNGSDPSRLLSALIQRLMPAPAAPAIDAIVPFVLQVDATGGDLDGQLALILPPGVGVIDAPGASLASEGLQWSLQLADGEQTQQTLWLRLPSSPGPLSLRAVVTEAAQPAALAESHLDLDLPDPPDLASLREQLRAHPGRHYRQARRQIERAIRLRNRGKTGKARGALLKAADTLQKIGTPAAWALREILADNLRRLGLPTPAG